LIINLTKYLPEKADGFFVPSWVEKGWVLKNKEQKQDQRTFTIRLPV